jgi:amino acid adenylation domain-containing protein/non-ribosomal peptide synthase protein (TIGR01720 family)
MANKSETKRTGLEVAVIGMAGRFPGARNIEAFWNNLKDGKEGITFFTEEELKAVGVPEESLRDPNYVKARGIVEEKESFDAGFFGYIPAEAEVMDPQIRLFHEHTWEALENAGYNPDTYEGLIGVYAGASFSVEREARTMLSETGRAMGYFEISQLAGKDFLPTRISYKLDLKGPAVSLQTACSTSLVAIHMACRALVTGECDMAVAGGVTLFPEAKSGYLYREGMIMSPDGRCRAFDARANGTVGGEGIAVVILKRLKDALDDNDTIHAVVKGSAINNDGGRRAGYSAPGVDGQYQVIKKAHRLARFEPESVTYVETHGTGTILGDPIEMKALTLAFDTRKRNYCAVGSVKTNIGHLDAAAGAAGFIKTVLCLKHKMIPPSLFFTSPNPAIDFAHSPFYVNTQLKEWKNEEYPLRAGVSSFGIGGTNAHAALEEAPTVKDSSGSRPFQLLFLSAKTRSALDSSSTNLARYFKENPGMNLADATYTLQVGRKAFPYRRMIVCPGVNRAINALTAAIESESASGASDPRAVDTPHRAHTFLAHEENVPVIFMFSGQGSQYAGMGLELYQTEPIFRNQIDLCFDILKNITGKNIKSVLYPETESEEAKEKINQFIHTSPVKFIFEYSLARLLIHWGIKPHAMIGHSFGEYAAACLSGVFSLVDALTLAALRGELMHELPVGAMLSVPLPQKELIPLLNDELSLAAVNSPFHCVVSGSLTAVEAFEKKMGEKEIECVRLRVPRAGHSKMTEPILKRFEEKVHQIKLREPQIPYISGLTGTWITNEQAMDPWYWARHLRETIRFADGLTELLKEENGVFIQIGSDRSLSTFVDLHPDKKPGNQVINLIRHPKDDVPDLHFLLDKIGLLWLYGVKIDWTGFYSHENRRRIPLPTYPFDRKLFLPGGDLYKFGVDFFSKKYLLKKPDMADWFYVPAWVSSPLAHEKNWKKTLPHYWLIFVNDLEQGLGARLVRLLQENNRKVTVVKGAVSPAQKGMGSDRKRQEEENLCPKNTGSPGDTIFTINPVRKEDYDSLIETLSRGKEFPSKIVHLWGVTGIPGEEAKETLLEDSDKAIENGFYSLFYLAQALGRWEVTAELEIEVITNHMQEVVGQDLLCPGKAAVLGLVKVIPGEYPNIRCRSIDIDLPSPGSRQEEQLVEKLVKEFLQKPHAPVVAFRCNYRWEQTFKPFPLKESQKESGILREKGVYMIIGGLGGIGFQLARYIAASVRSRLILTGRSALPPMEERDKWLETHTKTDRMSQKIHRVLELEALGTEVLVFSADVTDAERMMDVLRQTGKRFGRINGVIHAGGIPGGGVIQLQTKKSIERELEAKVRGSLVLNWIFKEVDLDFLILCSSLSSILPGFGQVGYGAANAFLDAYARYDSDVNGKLTMSINWGRWKDTGMAIALESKHREMTGSDLPGGMTAAEGVEAFSRLLGEQVPGIIVVENDLLSQVERFNKRKKPQQEESRSSNIPADQLYPRPQLSSLFAAPRNETEQKLAAVWQTFFGCHQVGIDDDFFQLGGDSLKATMLISLMQKELHIKFSLSKLFHSPTIRELSAGIAGLGFSKEKQTTIEPVEKKDYYALSSAQKRLYFLNRFDTIGTSYNVPSVVQINGDPEKERLQETVKALIQCHETLRTSFTLIDDQPIQRVHDEIEFKIEVITMDNDYAGDREEYIKKIVRDFIRPFDLEKAPLLRVGIVSFSGEEHLLLYDMHHIIADGMSCQILIEDFLNVYAGKKWSPPGIQYKDFAHWQNHFFKTAGIKEQEAYWLKEFSDEVPQLNLPTDFPRPGVQSFEGREYRLVVDEKETNVLRSLAREENATLFMALSAIYYVLLFKLSGQEDIVIGIPVAGRRHVESERIIGMFVNTLALRNLPTGEKSFRAFLKEVKEKSLSTFENQEYPFEELVERVPITRDTSRNPLFDVMFALHNIEIFTLEIPGLKLQTRPFESSSSKFDLNLEGAEIGDKLSFRLEYSTKLFKRDTIRRLLCYFQKIMTTVGTEPDIKIGKIEITSEEEKQELLSMCSGIKKEPKGPDTIHCLFERKAAEVPAASALVHNGGTLTYGELNRRANWLAHWLKTRGVKRDHVVGLMAESSFEMVAGMLAILKAGGAYLPIDPGYPAARKKYMLEDSRVSLLLTSTGYDAVAEHIPPNVEVTNIKDDTLFACQNRGEYPSKNEDKNPGHSNRSKCTDLLYVIYTSGSTGKPKGVMLEHQNLVNLLFFQYDYTCIDFSSVLQFTSISFDVSFQEIFSTLLAGGTLYLPNPGVRQDIPGLFEFIKKNRIKTLFLPASFLKFVLSREEFAPLIPGEIDHIVSAGEPLIVTERFRTYLKEHQVYLHNHYGPSETHVVTTLTFSPGEPVPDLPPIGKPIMNTDIYIVDKENHLQPIGIPGELIIGGKPLGRGYLREEGNEKFISGPFSRRVYCTGDIARWLPDGNIEFLGRADFQVKIRGFRVELGEIENRLLAHDKVSEAVVFAREETNGEKYLCAYVVSNEEEVDTAELRNSLSAHLPEYMIPSFIIVLDKIPLTPSRKLDRSALPLPDRLGTDGTYTTYTNFTAPRDKMEKKLAVLWSEVLSREYVSMGIDDNFFQIGGHSLKAAILIARIFKETNVKIPLPEIFKTPTVRGLSRYIKEAKKDKDEYVSIEAVEKKEFYPLSSAQKRLYILHQMEPETTHYNLPQVVMLEGKIETKKLEDGFKKLIERHESLRTAFHMNGDYPVQKIHRHAPFEIKEVEGSSPLFAPMPEVTTGINDFISPFDLSCVPLLRVGLLKLENQTFILMMDMHHIITDGISHTVFVEELTSLYSSYLSTDPEEALEPLRIQYKDYACWKESEKEMERVRNQETYWTDAFKGEIPILHLPFDYKRPAFQSFAGSSVGFVIEKKETDGLRKLAAAGETTLYTVLLGIFYVLLAKLSGQEDIVVGTPVAGRRHAELENIIGMFVNTLALRNYPLPGKTFKNFIKEVKGQTLEAFENQEYPFEDLVDRVSVRRDAGRNPLFDVFFVFQNMEKSQKNILGLELKPYPYKTNISKFDMTLTGIEGEDRLFFTFEYCTKLFRPGTIERFKGYFERMVSSLVENPGVLLAEIEIIGEQEKNRLLFEFNRTAAAFPRDKTIHQLFEEQVERTPNHIAMVGVIEQHLTYRTYMTYKELNKNSNQLAHRLRARGIKPDTIAAVMVERALEMIVGILAILKAGGAYLPIDPAYPEERKQYMLADSAAKIVLTTSDYIPEGEGIPGRYAPMYLPIEDHSIAKSDNQLITRNSQRAASLVDPGNLAYVIYTSGSTGKPKGVMVEHRSCVNILTALQKEYPLMESDTYLLKTSYTFDVSVTELFGWFLGGGRLVISGKNVEKDPGKILDIIEGFAVTHINFVPSMFNAFLELLEQGDTEKLSTLRYIFLAGEALSPGLVNKFAALRDQVVFENLYGPTEGTVYASRYSISHWDGESNIPIGKPLQNIGLYILDRKNHLQPMGAAGELSISGVGVSRGYLNRPDLTAEKFDQDFQDFHDDQDEKEKKKDSHHSALYKTGDLARWLPDGNVEFLGRMDDQVKVRGFRIELGEIESQLITHEKIKEAVVIAKKDQQGDYYLCAYMVMVPGLPVPAYASQSSLSLDITELRTFLSESLPDYMIPSYFVQMEMLPLLANGKVDKKALPEPGKEAGNSSSEYRAPANEIEAILLDIWEEVLPVKRIDMGTDGNFFELGGDSIKAIQVSARLKKYGLTLEFKDLFFNQTIRQLSRCVNRVERVIDQGLVEGDVPLTPIQQWFFENHPTGYSHYNHAVMITRKQGFEKDYIKKVFTRIVEHHDALRMVFEKQGNKVVQKNRGIKGKLFDLDVVHVKGRTNEEIEGQIERKADQVQGGIDLKEGPLIKLALFKCEKDDYLLIVIHHLVVDGISWRIILEDFAVGYTQVKNGEEIRFQEKTDSFKYWADTLIEYSRNRKVVGEAAYWGEVEKAIVENLPGDFNIEKKDKKGKDSETVWINLSEEETETLLHEVNQAYNTEINDILLTALGLAVKDFGGSEWVKINLEGHGRETAAVHSNIDISRTVGWFTSRFPVLLHMHRTEDLTYVIKHVKETLRALPQKGSGYGILRYLTPEEQKKGIPFGKDAEIDFNYLGQFDWETSGRDFEVSRLKTGNAIGPDLERPYALDINGIVVNGRLMMSFTYNKYEFTRARAEQLANFYRSNLGKIITHCSTKNGRELTPSDYRLTGLDIDDLEDVFSVFEEG